MSEAVNYRILSVILFFSCLTIPAYSQSGIKVKATVDKNSILIGGQIALTIKADIPENEPISFFSVDTLPHFEFIEKGKIDTSNTSTGTSLKQLIRITSFDTGHWVIPAFILDNKIATDSIPVVVNFSSPFDSSQAYHDIKGVVDVKVQKENEWWWFVAAATILVLVVIYFLIQKKKPAVKEVVIPNDPYLEAMQQLEMIRQQSADSKEYYSSLADVFRIYIAKKKGITSLQETTEDIVVQLTSFGLAKERFDQLSRALQLSDFVKFAKYIPAADDDTEVYHVIKQTITDIEQLN